MFEVFDQGDSTAKVVRSWPRPMPRRTPIRPMTTTSAMTMPEQEVALPAQDAQDGHVAALLLDVGHHQGVDQQADDAQGDEPVGVDQGLQWRGKPWAACRAPRLFPG
jgi:hypothetical protein